ncbi:hypothetical protein EG829_33380 [bacterium]|nr:hypothetical protein [bacterium]
MITRHGSIAVAIGLGVLAVFGWGITGFSTANDLRGVAVATLALFAVSFGCVVAGARKGKQGVAILLGMALLGTGMLAETTIALGTWPLWSGHAALRAGEYAVAARHFEPARVNYLAPRVLEGPGGRLGVRGAVLADFTEIETFRGIALVEAGQTEAGVEALESALKAAHDYRPPDDVEYIRGRLEWARGN